ncbi:hypothetical protein [Falsiroseomonas oryzae]|uniref:hypothetical protein n=1 Tax=Falsiroseomonas oryzae TaxID=2766473 RepID=UPI0022EB698F|nr:hypothetical protein [Roseomonas sp. MO-31]
MRRTTLALASLLLAAPAGAQQYWLPNGPGGTTYNNPQGSLLGTMNEHLLQRQFQQGATSQRAAARGADPSFRLNNTGDRIVREIYVSSAADSVWGEDRLGRDVLRPGERLVVPLPAGQCLNDIRVVFMDGQAQERRRVDTCALTDLQVR